MGRARWRRPALALPRRTDAADAGARPAGALRVFVDGSVLEIFTGDGLCLTTRLYPQRADSRGVVLFTAGAPVDVRRLSAWTLAAVW